jgi:hypothetical protein
LHILEELAQEYSLQHLKINFILMSPKESKGLKQTKSGDKISDMPLHIVLEMPQDSVIPHDICEQWKDASFLKPTRCTEGGVISKDGRFWKIEAIFRF